jgi:hypothetical protein
MQTGKTENTKYRTSVETKKEGAKKKSGISKFYN